MYDTKIMKQVCETKKNGNKIAEMAVIFSFLCTLSRNGAKSPCEELGSWVGPRSCRSFDRRNGEDAVADASKLSRFVV